MADIFYRTLTMDWTRVIRTLDSPLPKHKLKANKWHQSPLKPAVIHRDDETIILHSTYVRPLHPSSLCLILPALCGCNGCIVLVDFRLFKI